MTGITFMFSSEASTLRLLKTDKYKKIYFLHSVHLLLFTWNELNSLCIFNTTACLSFECTRRGKKVNALLGYGLRTVLLYMHYAERGKRPWFC
jgi:hypothetical protein